MSEPILSPDHPDLRIVLEANQRGWIEISTTSQVIGILSRNHASGEPFDLNAWLLQNDRLSEPQIRELRALHPPPHVNPGALPETVFEKTSSPSGSLLDPGATRMEQLDQSIRNMWAKESTSQPGEPRPSLPSEFAGYTDFEIIGAGGMGQIMRATDPVIGREIAIKTLHPELLSDQATLRRFKREAQITGRLEHPNIVPVHEARQAPDGTHFFSMKLVGGQSLAEVLADLCILHAEDDTTHDGTRLLPEFVKICDAIEFAHSRGIIHRDLKPANIMVGSFGEVLVMDWGLAKTVHSDAKSPALPESEDSFPHPDRDPSHISEMATQPGMTHDGTILGTPIYMPPEQAEGKIEEIDTQSDLYSLGAILYQILTLEPPIRGENTYQILVRVSEGHFQPPRECNPDALIPRDLEAVVLKAMARQKSDRYPNVAEMKADLQAYLEGRTLGAATYTPLQRVTKWVGRNRKVCSAVATMALLGSALFASFAWLEHRDLQNRYQKAFGSAIQHIESTGDISLLTAKRPPVDPRTGVERQDTPKERSRRKEAIRSYVAAAGALDRALQIRPEDSKTRRHRKTVGQAIGNMALQGRDYLLARQAFLQLEGHGIDSTEIERLVKEVDSSEQSVLVLRKNRLVAILKDLRQGLAREGRALGAPLLADYVFEAVSYRDRQTVDILSNALKKLTDKASNQRRPYDSKMTPSPVDRKDSFWSQPERDQATFLCRVLGRLGLPECVEPLGMWLSMVTDHKLAVEAGLALCNTREPQAKVYLLSARQRFSPTSETWRLIATSYPRIPSKELGRNTHSAGDFIQRARLHLESGDHVKAITLLTLAIKLAPKSWEAYFLLGVVQNAQGNLDAAIMNFNRSIELNPTNSAAFHSRANAYRNLQNFDLAFADYKKAIQMDPNHSHTYADRAVAHDFCQNFKAAISDYNRAIQIDPQVANHYINRGINYRTRNLLDQSIADFDRAIELDPNNALAWSNRGSAHLLNRKFDAAMTDYSQAIELNPRNQNAYIQRGRIFQETMDFQAALADYRRGRDIDPTHADAHLFLGDHFLAKNEFQTAITHYSRAIHRDPKCLPALLNRGRAYKATGKSNLALADVNKLLDIDPNYSEAYVNRGNLYHSTGDHDAALADYSKAIQTDPTNAIAYVNRANIFMGIKRIPDALKDFDRAIKLRPDDGGFYFNRGNCYLRDRQIPKALSDFTRAIELDPKHAGALGNRGLLFSRQKRFADAVADFDRAIRINPDHPIVRLERGNAHYFLRRYAQAAEDYRRAIELDPQNSQAHFNYATTLLKLRRHTSALEQIERALSIHPINPGLYKLRAQIHSEFGETVQEAKNLRRYLELHPNAPDRAKIEAYLKTLSK